MGYHCRLWMPTLVSLAMLAAGCAAEEALPADAATEAEPVAETESEPTTSTAAEPESEPAPPTSKAEVAVPEAAPDPEPVPEAAPDPEPVPEAAPDPEPVPEAAPDPEPVPEAAPDPEPVPEAAPDPEPVPEAAPDPEPVPEAAPDPEPVPEAAPDPEPVPEAAPDPEPVPEAAPDPEPVPEAAPDPEPVPEAAPDPEPVPEAAPDPEPVPEAAPDPEPVPEAAPDPEPVPEAAPDPEPVPEAAPDPEPVPEAALPFGADEPSRVHNVMVRVVVVDPDWHPFEVIGGWPDAVEIKESDSLKYFEVAIWEDVSAIHFYEFDNEFDAVDFGSGAAGVTAEREGYVIQRNAGLPSPWSAERSTFIRQAFASFTSDLVSRYPESAHHLVYQGHGGPGGALFAGQLFYEDASGILSHWTNELGFRLGVIDMGGPCTKGAFDDLENFCQYSHYYVASDLPNGGYTLDDWTLEKNQETNPDVQYHRLFADSSNLRDALSGRIDVLQKNYDYSRNNMISSKTEQANYLYSCKEFSDFGTAFRAFLTSADYDYEIFDDLYSFMIRNDVSEELLRAFDNVIVHQADNRDFFEWEEDSHGMLMPLD